jgi:flagellar protein FlaF
VNAVERAKEGYGRSAVPIKSHRAAEYEAIARISHRLRAAAMKRTSNYAEFVEALSENSKLWTTLAVDVAQPENQLPQDLRARLFWLAEFTTQETAKILKNEGDVSILIEINAAVLQGLRGRETVS